MTCVKLEPHTGSARSQAVATKRLTAGSLIVSCEALTTVLLPQEKGQRCDACHRKVPRLQKCTGCASYWYCSTNCQALQWQSHHKKICKRFNKYTSSLSFQALAAHEKLDALLLSHLVAQLDGGDSTNDERLVSVTSLLPGPIELSLPPIVYSGRIAESVVRNMFSRFGNNNFVVHSHLTTFGHGIFPLASRLFNHSCLPNAAAKYILSPSNPPKMEVVALREISLGEEICLPYLDPALLQSRQQIFQMTYGFECRCPSCVFLERIGPIPTPPTSPDERDALALKLAQFMNTTPHDGLTLTSSAPFPSDLVAVFHESFITYVAETFRNASHDGVYAVALTSGKTLLALYRLIYPPNYPQIGMHLLELAKTYWNSIVSENIDMAVERTVKQECWTYVNEARDILGILGPEGDEDGPLTEIETLDGLLQDN
ncbi:hypothetical protein B0H19DRAFT_405427 [Mycena capillaripes]|nr:hypothetical protein B0H19DRAFT_405427 [Mycena capillaripes]